MTKKDITDTTKLSPELMFAVAATDAVPVLEKLPIKDLLGARARWDVRAFSTAKAAWQTALEEAIAAAVSKEQP